MSSWLKRMASVKICKFEINYSRLHPRNLKKLSFKKIIRNLVIFIIFWAAVITVKDEIMYEFDLGPYSEYGYNEIDDQENYCNVAGIELHGDVVTYISPDSFDQDGNQLNDETSSDYVMSRVYQAEIDDNIKAIIFEVNSFGGSAVAAEEMSKALKKATKPTVAFVREGATSAAYWASTGADIIFASALSDVGGIGVTMSYVDYSKKNIKDGLTYNSLSTGKFKDYGNSAKPLTTEERELLIRDLDIMHDNFVKAVANNRNLDINKVRALADGSSMPGEMALANGLIDRIGGIDEVRAYLKEKIGQDINDCWE